MKNRPRFRWPFRICVGSTRAHSRGSAERNSWLVPCTEMIEELGDRREMTDSWFSNSGTTSGPGARGLQGGVGGDTTCDQGLDQTIQQELDEQRRKAHITWAQPQQNGGNGRCLASPFLTDCQCVLLTGPSGWGWGTEQDHNR